jgi:hypothetical protein
MPLMPLNISDGFGLGREHESIGAPMQSVRARSTISLLLSLLVPISLRQQKAQASSTDCAHPRSGPSPK